MAELLTPSWNMLDELVASAENRVLICAPFYTRVGITHLFDDFGTAKKFQFWSRMNPSDWAHGATNPEELVTLIDILRDDGREIELRLSPYLHAKAYIADDDFALIGSSNLSDGGFDRNIEILIQFKNDEAKQVIRGIETSITAKLRETPIDKFRDWVNNNKAIIQELQENDVFPDNLKGVQKSLDEMLGYGNNKTAVKFDHLDGVSSFVTWMQKNKDLPGAEELLSRYKNIHGDNLTGHFRQCFFGALGFFLTNQYITEIVSNEMKNLRPSDIYNPSPDIKNQWMKYLEDNATLSGDQFNYAILRGILPPGMGGTVIGGGGGISTIKRMLPLVARFLLENSNG
jgi:HKD family nuclease